MKQLIITIALLFSTISLTSATTINELFNKMARSESVEKVSVGKFMMGFSSLFTETLGVQKVEVMSMENCCKGTRKTFSEMFKKINDPLFETLISVNEDGERVKILARQDDKYIKEVVILVDSESDPVIVRILGNIDPAKIQEVCNKYVD